MIKKYKNRPIVIEAVQLIPDNVTFLVHWARIEIDRFETRDVNGESVMEEAYYIPNVVGEYAARMGSYIIKDQYNSFTTMGEQEFLGNHEEID